MDKSVTRIWININGEIEEEKTGTSIFVGFYDIGITMDKKTLIEKIKKIIKKYDIVESVAVVLYTIDKIEEYKNNKLIDFYYDFKQKVKKEYDNDFRTFIETKIYYDGEDNKIKKDLIKDIESIYDKAQEIYMQFLQEKLKEVV